MDGLVNRAGYLFQTSGSLNFAAARICESLKISAQVIHDACQLEPQLFVEDVGGHGASRKA